MEKQVSWWRRARYTPLEFGVFLLIAIVVMSLGAFSVMRRATMHFRTTVTKAVQVTPLPEIVVEAAEEPQTVEFRKQYEFSRDWMTRNVAVWKKLFGPLTGKPGVQYLEIGVFEGRSLIWMLENILTDPTARATAVDLFDDSYRDIYLRNIGMSGLSNKVTPLAGFSQVTLRQLPLNTFDIIYVDGSHAKDDALEDAVLCWRLLKDGGYMIFDDYRCILPSRFEEKIVSPKPAVDAFVQCFEDECEVIHNDYQLIIRKKAEQAEVRPADQQTLSLIGWPDRWYHVPSRGDGRS